MTQANAVIRAYLATLPRHGIVWTDAEIAVYAHLLGRFNAARRARDAARAREDDTEAEPVAA